MDDQSFTIVINNLYDRHAWFDNYGHVCVSSRSESESKVLCILKSRIVEDGHIETLSVGGWISREGDKEIVGGVKFKIIGGIWNCRSIMKKLNANKI